MAALELFIILPLILLAISILFRRKSKSASTSHGPKTYPIIGCLPSFYKNRFRLLDWYTELVAGSPTQTVVVDRVGAGRIVVTANPENVEYILKTNFPNYPKGKPFTDLLGDLLGCGIFNVDGELWASQRKLASHEFSTKSLREFVVSVLEEEVGFRLVPLLERAAFDGAVVDLQDVLKRFTYDTICKVSLGTDPDCLDLSRPPPPLLTSFESAAGICARRAAAPLYAIWKLKRALNLGSESHLRAAASVVHDSIDAVIAGNLRRNSAGAGDLLSRLIAAGHSGEIVRDMLVSFIMAGRDTTAAALTWLFWLLSTNRSVERELRDETARLSDSFEKLDYEAIKEMRFAHACLCETMRLYPPVAWDSKHAAGDDVLPDGTRVPAGTRVTYFPYGMGRMENLWGKDRFEFRPDRWFEEPVQGEKVLKSVSPFVYPVFQAGPRVCLGKDMAFTQMKYVVASLVNRFEFEPVQQGQPGFIPLLTAHMAGGLKVRVKIRGNLSMASLACESK